MISNGVRVCYCWLLPRWERKWFLRSSCWGHSVSQLWWWCSWNKSCRAAERTAGGRGTGRKAGTDRQYRELEKRNTGTWKDTDRQDRNVKSERNFWKLTAPLPGAIWRRHLVAEHSVYTFNNMETYARKLVNHKDAYHKFPVCSEKSFVVITDDGSRTTISYSHKWRLSSV